MITYPLITYYAGHPVDAFIKRCGHPTLRQASSGRPTPTLLVYKNDDLVLTLPYDDMWHRWWGRARGRPGSEFNYDYFIKVVERYIRRRVRCL